MLDPQNCLVFCEACTTTGLCVSEDSVFGIESESKLAKEFHEVRDYCSVYIYRDDPHPMHNELYVGGDLAGRLLSDGFLLLKLKPGAVAIRSNWGSGDLNLTFNCDEGRIYFVNNSPSFWLGSKKLEIVPEEVGKAAVLDARYMLNSLRSQ